MKAVTSTVLSRSLSSFAALLCLGAFAWAQDNSDRSRVGQTEAQIADYKRIWELLRHPTFISLRLASKRRDTSNEAPSTTPSPYVVGEMLHFQSFITQNSNEELQLAGNRSPYYAYRPQLIADGDVVPYTKHAQERIEAAESASSGYSNSPMTLPPEKEYPSNDVRLEDWYDAPLKPGHYQLTIKRRFTGDGDWVESNPVTFELVTSKTSVPGQAQSDSDELAKLKQSVKETVSKEKEGWTYRSIEPIQGSRNVIVQQWQLNDIIVSVALTRYENAAKAQDALAGFKAQLRIEENARTKIPGKPFRLIKEDSNAWGDEGFVWDVRGSEAVAFRKGKFIVSVSVPQPATNKDVFFSRKFAEHVIKALNDQ